MSIFSRTGEPTPLEALSRQSTHFVGRRDLIRRFVRRINDTPTAGRVLFIHGMGGNGKSTLLRYLQARCCVRFAPREWRKVSELLDSDMERVLSGTKHKGVAVATALLDFGVRSVGHQRPLEALSALFVLKRQLARHGIRTPRFDFAAVTYLQKSGLDYKQLLPEFFPKAELDIATGIADFLAGLPIATAGKAVMRLFGDRTREALARWKMAKTVGKDDVIRVLEAPAEPTLIDLLPYYFAADVNAALSESGPRSRVVLFFDTHEAFWGEDALPAAGGVSLASIARDKWLRIVLGNLNLESGVVAVVAGRRPPRWSVAEEAAIPDDGVEVEHLAGLSRAEAAWYLQRVGVTDERVQEVAIGYASASADDVHPYMLGLCTDVFVSQGSGVLDLADRVAGDLATRGRVLVARLMSAVSPDMQRTVVAVAACRSFDYHIFAFLAERLRFAGSLEDYQRLTNFSFVMQQAGGTFGDAATSEATFAVHQLLRRELALMFETQSMDAHRALVDFYEEKLDSSGQAEAALHLSHIDESLAAKRWCSGMDDLLAAGRFSECQPFISVLSELRTSSDESRMALYYRTARAYLGSGAVAEAEALRQQLVVGSAEELLLHADIQFVRCEFEDAEATAGRGLAQVSGADLGRLQARLAEILLYRGQFVAAQRVLDEAKAQQPRADSRHRLVLTMLEGEVAMFSGDIAAAGVLFRECRDVIERGQADAVGAGIVGWNLAALSLLDIMHEQWAEAFVNAEASLRVRESVSDARGSANALLLMGRARSGAGRYSEGLRYLGRSGRLSVDQGDVVTLAKVRHSEAMVRYAIQEPDQAIELLNDALTSFRERGVPYDVANALLDLARVHRSARSGREMVSALDSARAALAAHQFGLLSRQYSHEVEPPAARIRSGLLCFVAGDALGAPWEGRPPDEISFEPGDRLPQRHDWPVGSTTDDTDQLLAVAETLGDARDDAPGPRLLSRIAAVLPDMRGGGPTTRAAVERFLATGQAVAVGGDTNGATVRALAIGWSVPVAHADRRRELTDQLTRTTHAAPGALVTAQIVSAMASWAVEEVEVGTLLSVAAEELELMTTAYRVDEPIVRPIRMALDGQWRPPRAGVPILAVDTTAAVLAVLRVSDDPATAMLAALRLGGDTDSVAATVGGLLGCRLESVIDKVPWMSQVRQPEPELVVSLASRLANERHAYHR